MSDTHRRGTVYKDGKPWYNKYWYHHDPSWYRRALNKAWRVVEKQYFRYFGEYMRKSKNRGWYW